MRVPYKLGEPVYTTDWGNKVYMFLVKDSASLCRKISLMVESSEGELSKKFDVSFQKLVSTKSPLEFLYNMGFDRDEILTVTNKVKNAVKDCSVVGEESAVPIQKVHRILTQDAILDEKTLMIDGKKYCAYVTEEFRKKIKEMNLGYKNHLEILENFRLMGILHGNRHGDTMRNDYRGTDHIPYYCFLPAEGVDENSNVWGGDDDGT